MYHLKGEPQRRPLLRLNMCFGLLALCDVCGRLYYFSDFSSSHPCGRLAKTTYHSLFCRHRSPEGLRSKLNCLVSWCLNENDRNLSPSLANLTCIEQGKWDADSNRLTMSDEINFGSPL